MIEGIILGTIAAVSFVVGAVYFLLDLSHHALLPSLFDLVWLTLILLWVHQPRSRHQP